MKGGFYPAPSDAVALALRHLRPPSEPDAPFAILDPCAGEGEAIGQLADGLGCRPDLVHAIELESSRAEKCRQRLPEAQLLAPASYFGCRIRSWSFSLVWCNPPFDDEIGGGERVEGQFLGSALALLAPKGILCLVCPERVWRDGAIRRVLLTWFDDVSCVEFPADCRRFGEVIVFGIKRREMTNPDKRTWGDLVTGRTEYTLPKSNGPRGLWRKIELTPEELDTAFAQSPLRRMLEPPPERPLPRPPMALGKGHLALLLASGHLDGLVCPPGEPPHVVRGTAKKVEEVTDVEEDESKGTRTTKTTYTERITLTVRAVGADGVIHTFAQE